MLYFSPLYSLLPNGALVYILHYSLYLILVLNPCTQTLHPSNHLFSAQELNSVFFPSNSNLSFLSFPGIICSDSSSSIHYVSLFNHRLLRINQRLQYKIICVIKQIPMFHILPHFQQSSWALHNLSQHMMLIPCEG